MFLWRYTISLIFSYFLKSCIVFFTFEEVSSSSIYWLASGERYLHLLVQQGILRLLQIFSMDVPSLHFLFSLRGEFLRFHAFSQSCEDRLGAESLLSFPLGQCPEILKFMSILPVPQSWDHFLCLFARHLQGLALTVHRSSCWEPAMGRSWV